MPKAEEQTQKVAKIYVGAEDKIGLPNYSSVTISGSVSREVPDTGDDAALQSELRRNFVLVEEVLAEERQNVLRSLQEEAKGGSGGS